MVKFSRFFNNFILVFGIVCILYWLGMGLAVRFGQSLLWLWPLVGIMCIARHILVRRAMRTGRALPISARLVRALRAALCAGLAVFFIGEAFICSGAFARTPQGLDCIVVLGARVNGTRPSGALAQRIDAAAAYLADNPDTLCIASGGQGADEEMSEAACIAQYLAARGIAPERIILEDESTDTLSNLENSFALMPRDMQAVGIVTNDFHVFRALATARHVAPLLDVSGIPAPSTPYGFVHYAMREFFAVGAGLMSGELAF